VGVPLLAQVEERGPGAGVYVLHDLELIEALQHPVDRGRGDAGRAPLDLGDDVVGGEVAVGVEQHGHHHPGRHRDAAAGPADGVVDPIGGRLGQGSHGRNAIRRPTTADVTDMHPYGAKPSHRRRGGR
jgi:hypothetical protein